MGIGACGQHLLHRANGAIGRNGADRELMLGVGGCQQKPSCRIGADVGHAGRQYSLTQSVQITTDGVNGQTDYRHRITAPNRVEHFLIRADCHGHQVAPTVTELCKRKLPSWPMWSTEMSPLSALET